MLAFRYDHDNYFFKSYFTKDIFKKLMGIGVKYSKGHFFIPVNKKDEVKIVLPSVEFIDGEFSKYIFIGEFDKDIVQIATLNMPLYNGQYIYLIDCEKSAGLINIKRLKYFNMNKLAVQQYNLKLEKPLNVQDLFYNTDIGFSEFKELFYSQTKTLDLTQMINRICLSAG